MFRTMLAALAVVMTGTFAAADPVEGIWQTEPDEGNFAHVQMAPCGAAICGTIVRTFNAEGEYQSENIGRVLVIDMVPAGGGEYEGSVWRPSNDKIYIGNMTLNGDALRLRGCVAGGLICSGQDWVRVQ
jgi:uncharacterized protein (DUF2147 family)